MAETPRIVGVSDTILIIEVGYASDDRPKIHAQFQTVQVFHVEPTDDLFAFHLGAAAAQVEEVGLAILYSHQGVPAVGVGIVQHRGIASDRFVALFQMAGLTECRSGGSRQPGNTGERLPDKCPSPGQYQATIVTQVFVHRWQLR